MSLNKFIPIPLDAMDQNKRTVHKQNMSYILYLDVTKGYTVRSFAFKVEPTDFIHSYDLQGLLASRIDTPKKSPGYLCTPSDLAYSIEQAREEYAKDVADSAYDLVKSAVLKMLAENDTVDGYKLDQLGAE